MKNALWILAAAGVAVAEPEGTIWYDSEGNVAMVEGAGAEPVEEPFVAEWRQREIERRERGNRAGAWSLSNEVWRGRQHGVYGGFGHGGFSPVYFRPFHRTYDCYRPIRRAPRASVIIRW